jgi:hypothetical protein
MRIALSSALAISLLGAALLAQLLYVGIAETSQRSAEAGAAMGQHPTVFRSSRDQRQMRSFEALVGLIALKAGPRQAWHPPDAK